MGCGKFCHKEHNFNKLGRGLQDDVTCQISRLYGLCFIQGDNLMFSLYISLRDPLGRAIFDPRGIF